jgi:thiamine-phosphate pyrophosphorylase
MNGSTPPRLMVISDAEQGALGPWFDELSRLLFGARPGSVLVLLRDRQLPIRERLELGERLRRLTQEHGQGLLVSDRLDLAALLDADGVHLSEASVRVEDARAFAAQMGKTWLISAACHTPEQLSRARADALLLSPILAPRKGRPALGVDGLTRALEARHRRAAGLGPCWLYALGGVTRDHAAELLAAGADGVALIGDLFVPGAAPALLASLGIERT